MFKRNYSLLLALICLAASPLLAGQNEKKGKPQEVHLLSLSYIAGGNFTYGHYLSAEDLIRILSSFPHVSYLDLSGQLEMSEELYLLVHNQMPQLKKIILSGNLALQQREERVWQEIRWMPMTAAKLSALFQDNSSIQSICLKMSTVDDEGLQAIGFGGRLLEEINLSGCANVSDEGIDHLLEGCPLLKEIYLFPIALKKAAGAIIHAPQVSLEKIEELKERGIAVYH